MNDRSRQNRRRREALRLIWSKGSLVLLLSALSGVLLAFVFYDHPIIDDTQIISYLRGAAPDPNIQ